MTMANDEGLTLVIDIGKSRAKLLMFDAQGQVCEQHAIDNRSIDSPQGYLALDLPRLTQWVTATLAASQATRHCRRAIATTHGAAMVGLGYEGLAWLPIDYEFDGYEWTNARYQADRDPFEETWAPDLPAGLNAARQLYWLERTHPKVWARTECLLPYPQFWAWWLSGEVASEVSSLGCHTQLWRPVAGGYAALAQRRFWNRRFAPMRPASSVLGPVTAQRALATGLPPTCQVHVGVHDSNACLARHQRHADRMALVSTGTWVVVMAPGAPAERLGRMPDTLANVSVDGEVVPTARFMGGRELETLCAGASPSDAQWPELQALIQSDTHALPAFAPHGGPFSSAVGGIWRGQRFLGSPEALASPSERATLAATYCALMTAYLLDALDCRDPVVVEGPFAHNSMYLLVLAALRPLNSVWLVDDPVEGTARGAWALTRRAAEDAPAGAAAATPLQPVASRWRPELQAYQQRWLALLNEAGLVGESKVTFPRAAETL